MVQGVRASGHNHSVASHAIYCLGARCKPCLPPHPTPPPQPPTPSRIPPAPALLSCVCPACCHHVPGPSHSLPPSLTPPHPLHCALCTVPAGEAALHTRGASGAWGGVSGFGGGVQGLGRTDGTRAPPRVCMPRERQRHSRRPAGRGEAACVLRCSRHEQAAPPTACTCNAPCVGGGKGTLQRPVAAPGLACPASYHLSCSLCHIPPPTRTHACTHTRARTRMRARTPMPLPAAARPVPLCLQAAALLRESSVRVTVTGIYSSQQVGQPASR